MPATPPLNEAQREFAERHFDSACAFGRRIAAERGIDPDEGESVAMLGLTRAAARFDPQKMREADSWKFVGFKIRNTFHDEVIRKGPFGDVRTATTRGESMPTQILETDGRSQTDPNSDSAEPTPWAPADRDGNTPDGWLAVLRESTDSIRRSFTEVGTAQGRRGALVVEAATANLGLAAVDAIRAVRQRIDAINLGFVADFEKELAALDEAVNKAHRLGRMPAVLIGLSATAVEAVETVAVLAERVEAAAGAVGKEPRDHRGRPRTSAN